jgi:hypothetical protein
LLELEVAIFRHTEKPIEVLGPDRLRASPAGRGEAVVDIVIDARSSAAAYDVERDGHREALFGVSVFAQRAGQEAGAVLERFPDAPIYLIITVGTVRALGFAVVATGVNADHYDVQLVPGVEPAAAASVSERDLESAARRLVEAAEDRPNPAYDGPQSPSAGG